MKKLKKILLINWLYFSKELIEVDEVAGVASFVELAKQNGRTLFI